MYMMRTIYLLIAFAGLCMASCQEVTIGYLKTEHAKYSIDTLYVGERSILEQIEAMELQYPPELKEMALAYRELKVLEEEMDGMYAESNALEEELASLDEETDAERMDEIYTRLDEIDEWFYHYDDLDGIYGNGLDVFWNEGFDYVDPICDEYIGLISKVEEAIPWSTSTIEGVLGTQPIMYSIADVTSTDGNANLFKEELVMHGGGRMQLPFACKAPKGTYRVAIIIDNEGYSHRLDNVFTFIID